MENGWKAMAIDIWINRIGFIITIIAAIFSWYQVYRAKKIKDEISEGKRKHVLVELISKANSARVASSKLIPSSKGKQDRGFNHEDSLKIVQQFLEVLNDNKHWLNSETIEKSFIVIKNQFKNYTFESNFMEKKELGNSIYDNLSLIISELNKLYNE